MSAAVWYALTSVTLFTIGLYGTITGEDVLRRLLALNIMGSGVFLLFVSVAHRRGEAGPDPVPHAMVLTGIVVAVSATALALALARRLHAQDEDGPPDLSD